MAVDDDTVADLCVEQSAGRILERGASVEQWRHGVGVGLGDAASRLQVSDLDPANAERYESHASAYRAELEDLQTYAETQLAGIPAENRVLVTNHDSLGYMARDYDLQVLGTVLPAASTLADPSASDLAELIQEIEETGICTLFTETTVSDKLAQTVAAELEGCDEVRVLGLYTGAVGPAGSGTESYIGMFRYNVDTIVEGLE